MAVRLFVGNLPYEVNEAELRDHFSAIGPLSYVYLPTDRETGKPRGFAFVEFSNDSHAQEAIRRLNNQPFKGRTLAINEARAREDSPRTGLPPRPASARPASLRPDQSPRPNIADSQARAGETGRGFGPDAPPRQHRSKTKGRPKSDRAPKGPMREVVKGQFYFGDDDEPLDDELMGENLASRVSDSEDEDED
jgi:RNA recognition motif-containing protein